MHCRSFQIFFFVFMNFYFNKSLHLQTVSVTVSVLTLTFISMDRWYAICFPLRYKPKPERAWRTLGVIWIIAFLSGKIIVSCFVFPFMRWRNLIFCSYFFPICYYYYYYDRLIKEKCDLIFYWWYCAAVDKICNLLNIIYIIVAWCIKWTYHGLVY